jgi:fibronectin-binding autotransporter adhesin
LGGNVTLTTGKTLTIAGSAASENYAGTIQGEGNLTVNTTSGQILSGLNTYTGVTTLSGNTTLIVNYLANGGIASGIGASSNAAANLVFTGTGTSAPRVRYNGATYAETDRRFTLSGNGGFDVNSSGSVNWTNTAAITHGVTTAKTIYFLGAGTGTGTMAAQITDSTGATSISKGGAGSTNTWILTNPNSSFTGDITLNTTTASAGTLAYASAGGTNAIKFLQTTSTATLSYIGSGQTMSGAITANALQSGTITLDSSGTGAINYSSPTSLGNAGASGAKGLVLSGTNTGNNILAGQWVNNTAGGAATLTKNGVGKWTLTNTNSYTGATVINGGTLQLGNNTSTGALTGTASITNNGNLTINRDNTFTQATDLAGVVISGTGSFTQAGSGTTTLSLANTYTGPTNVNAGTLIVTGSTVAASTVTVASGATLGGTGTVSGAITVSGRIAPGTTGIGELKTGAVTWNSGNAWQFDLAAAAGSADKLAITGNFTKGTAGTYLFDFMGSAPNAYGNIYDLVTWTGTTDFIASNFTFTGLTGSYNTGTFSITGSTLQFTAIPEPTTALAGLLLGLGLLRRKRA